MGLVPERKDKTQVNYKHRESCATCDHFYAPTSCEYVQGPVSMDMVCNLYEVKSLDKPYRDREFFIGEFEKTNNKGE